MVLQYKFISLFCYIAFYIELDCQTHPHQNNTSCLCEYAICALRRIVQKNLSTNSCLSFSGRQLLIRSLHVMHFSCRKNYTFAAYLSAQDPWLLPCCKSESAQWWGERAHNTHTYKIIRSSQCPLILIYTFLHATYSRSWNHTHSWVESLLVTKYTRRRRRGIA